MISKSLCSINQSSCCSGQGRCEILREPKRNLEQAKLLRQDNIKSQSDCLRADIYMSKTDGDLNQGKKKHQSQREQKKVEIFVIPFAYTGSNPWTVMVKSFNAHIAIITMCRPRGSENVAGIAKFYFLRVRFHCAGVKYRLLLADGSVDVSSADGYLTESRVLVVTENFGNDSRVDQGQEDHENQSGDVKYDREEDQVPILRIGGESIEQAHPKIDAQKCSYIVFGFGYDKAKFFLITIIGDFSDLVHFILGHADFLFGASSHYFVRVARF